MADEFKTVVKVGMNSTEFVQGTGDINRQLKVLDSEFKAVQEKAKTYGDNIDTLTKKKKLLNDKIDIQNRKVADLKAQYEKSRAETGENSKATEKLAIRYNNAVKSLNKFEGQLTKVNKDLDKQKVNLKDIADKASKYGTKIAKGIAVGTGAILAMGAGMLKLATNIGETADRLLDLNSITGMSTDEIQKWQHATIVAGTSLETVTNASQQLTKTLTSMDSESNKSRQALGKLHLSLSDIKKSDADTQMNKIITALQGVTNKSERAKIGTDLFGKKWQELAPIIDLGVEGLKNAKDNANVFTPEQLNKANEFRIKWDEIKYNFQQMALIIGSKLIPVIEIVLDRFSNKMPEIEERIEKFLTTITPILTIVGTVLCFIVDNIQVLLPLIIGIGTVIAGLKMVSFVSDLTKSFKSLGAGGMKVTAIILGVVAALTALAAIIAIIMGKDLGNAFDEVGNGVSKINDSIKMPNIPDEYINGSHANGLSRVPFDGYRAELHKDEEVLRADDPRNSNNTKKYSGNGIYIDKVIIDAKELEDVDKAVKTLKELEQTVKQGAGGEAFGY